jgi:hypothetical protein
MTLAQWRLVLALPNHGAWYTTALGLPQRWATFVFSGTLVVGVRERALILASSSAIGRLTRRGNSDRAARSTDSPASVACGRRRGVALLLAVPPIGALAIGASNWAGVSPQSSSRERPPLPDWAKVLPPSCSEARRAPKRV